MVTSYNKVWQISYDNSTVDKTLIMIKNKILLNLKTKQKTKNVFLQYNFSLAFFSWLSLDARCIHGLMIEMCNLSLPEYQKYSELMEQHFWRGVLSFYHFSELLNFSFVRHNFKDMRTSPMSCVYMVMK